MNAKFIVVEGLDGSGKTIICKEITKILRYKNIQSLLVREPGGTLLSEKIRKIIKYGILNEVINPLAELFLLYASRIQLTKNIIQPSLSKNIWVISDRYELSSYAYQGGGKNIDITSIDVISKISMNGFTPDLTIYLDIVPEISIIRSNLRNKNRRVNNKNINFLKMVRNQYLNIVSNNSKCIIIDASKNIDTVKRSIKNLILGLINK